MFDTRFGGNTPFDFTTKCKTGYSNIRPNEVATPGFNPNLFDSSSGNEMFDVDELIKKIDAKIAELEAEEKEKNNNNKISNRLNLM